jgi:hypothetical protein
VADPDRDTVYTNDGVNRNIYTRESNSTGWFVGIIVALALLAIAYLVFSANSQPSTVNVDNSPAVTTPADTNTTPMAPVDTLPAPAETAPADTAPAPAEPVTPAPVETTPAPAAPVTQ